MSTHDLRHRLAFHAAAAVLAFAAPVAPNAFAADATTPTATVTEVVVTAQRRSEKLLDVPVSVTALTAGDIEKRGLTSLNDLQTAVPGLRMVDTGVGQQRISLRGISQYLGLPTVGNYVDEVSVNAFGAGSGLDIRLLDLDRVEVLRGPQPTLYGDESMGGTIRYVTASPNLHLFSANATGQVGVIDKGSTAGRADATINLPLIDDKLGVRIVAGYDDIGGWVDNPSSKDVNDTTVATLRAKVLFKPTDKLTVSLLVLEQRADQASVNYSDSKYKTFETNLLPANDRYSIENLVASYDFGAFTFVNSIGLVDRKARSTSDSASFYNQLFGAPVIISALGDAEGSLHSWTEEARVVSNSTGPIRYTFGGLYTDSESDGVQVGAAQSPIAALVGALSYNLPYQSTSKSYAIYGSAGYDVTKQLGFDIGGRYFHDERSPDGVQKGDFSSFNPRASVQYKFSSDGLIYADVAKGFRSGGFNTVAPTDTTTPHTYGPESLYTYEIGGKKKFFSGRVLAEVAVYYNDYKNIQATIVQANGNSAQTNAGRASGYGVDTTVHAQVTSDAAFSATVGYVDMHYDVTTVDRKSGEPLDMTPPWTWSIAGDYTPALSSEARLNLHADYGFANKAQLTLHNPAFTQTAYTENRAILDAHIGILYKKYEAYIYANNITNQSKILNPQFGGYFQPMYTKPREIGVGLKAAF